MTTQKHALMLMMAFIPINAMAADWRTFTDPEGIFSFDAPLDVHVARQAGTRPDGITMQTRVFSYGANKPGELACAVTETEYGSSVDLAEDTPKTMAATIKSQLQTLHVQADVDTPVTVDGRNGWRLEFKDLKGNGVAFRWFVVRNRLFQLICTTPPNASAAEKEETAQVANSFRFLAR